MAISFGTGTVKKMTQWWTGDTLTGWGAANDGLDAFGAEIQGTSCVVLAARKNETIQLTYTSALNSVPAGSQLIFNTYTVLGNILNALSITVNDGATGTASFNILSEFTGVGPALNLKSFVAIAMDLEAGTLNPATNNLANISYNLTTQNVTLRATDNCFLDVAYVGDGVTLEGTTVGNKLFTEAQAQDISNDIHNGVLQAFEGVIFAQHDIDINTTTGNSDNESLTFIETLNGANSYELNGTGTAVFSGTNIQSTGTVTSVIDMSNMTAFTMTAGSINNITTVTFSSGQTIQRAAFTGITTLNTGTSTFNTNSLDTITTANLQTSSSGLRLQSCDNVTITSGSDLVDSIIQDSGRIDISGGARDILRCQFTDPSATTAVILASPTTIANITNCTFTRTTGTANAVDIGDVGTNTSITWSGNTLVGYGTQSVGNNIASTANGAIAVNFTSNVTLDITLAAGATPPTVEISGTGTVNLISAVALDVSGLLGNTEVRIYENPSLFTGGSSSVEAAGVETVAAVTQANTGSNYIFYLNDLNPNVIQIQRQGAGVDFTTIGLVSGDKIRVVVRTNDDNPTLQLFDEFEVNGTVTSTVIPIVDVAASSTLFSSILDSSNGKTVTIEKVAAVFSASISTGTYDVFTYRIGSLPIITKGLVITSDTTLPLSQAGDRVYNNPA